MIVDICFIENIRISLILWPYDSIGSVSERWWYRNRPHTSICSKYLNEVFVCSDIIDIWSCIGVTLAFKIVKRRRILQDQFKVEFEKEDNGKKEGNFE